jgi:hypothetical protein
MKKIIVLLVLLVLFIGCAKRTSEYQFSWDLLDSLYSCETALYYMEQSRKDSNDVSKILEEEMSANNRFSEAKIAISKYTKDSNQFIQGAAKGVIVGIDIIMDANNKTIQHIRQISNYNENALKDVDFKIAELVSQKKEGWMIIARSASFLMPVIIEGAKSENPTGLIPFKISKDERIKLLKRLNELFKEMLQRFDNYYALKKQGLEGNPEDLTWLSFTVDRIRGMLSFETYEEVAAKDKNNNR